MGIRRVGVGDQLEVRDAQAAEDLGAGAVFDHGGGHGLHGFVGGVLVDGAREHLGEGVADAVGAEIDDRAAPGVLDHLHRFGKRVAGGVVIATRRCRALLVEDIAEQIALVHADEGWFFVGDRVVVFVEVANIADGQRKVRHRINE